MKLEKNAFLCYIISKELAYYIVDGNNRGNKIVMHKHQIEMEKYINDHNGKW